MEEKEKIVVPAEMCDRAETEKEIVLKKKSLWKQLVMGVVYALVLVFVIIDSAMVHLLLLYRPALSLFSSALFIVSVILLFLLLMIVFKAVTEIFIDRKYKNATADKKAEKKRSARKICRIVFGCSFLIIMTTWLCILTYSSIKPILHPLWSEEKCLYCNEYHSTGRYPGIKYIEYDPNYKCPYCGKIGDRHTCDQGWEKKCEECDGMECCCTNAAHIKGWEYGDNSNE